MSRALAQQPIAWDENPRIVNYFRQAFAVAECDVRKLAHDPIELFTRMIQPLLWMLIFGQVLNRTKIIPTGDQSYLGFIAPGILAQGVLFGAIFYGISLIWERDLGILQKFLVSPAPRSALVLGRALSSMVRGLCQMVFVYILAIILRLPLQHSIGALIGVLVAVMIGAAIFSTFSLIMACIVKSRERFMGIGQALTMPLFFVSNAIYPIALMPSWLRFLSKANPLTYQVDALRHLMISGGQGTFGLTSDFVILGGVFLLMIAVGSRSYPRIVT
jgi:ABC-2 type transport system permease protein